MDGSNLWSLDNFIPGGSSYNTPSESVNHNVEYQYQMEIEQLKIQQTVWMQDQTTKFQTHCDNIKQEYQEEIRKMRTESTREFFQIQQECKEQIQFMNAAHTNEVNSMRSSHARALEEAHNEINVLRKELQQMEVDFNHSQEEQVGFKDRQADAVEQLKQLGLKYSESLEKNDNLQDEIAQLQSRLDLRGGEVRRLEKEIANLIRITHEVTPSLAITQETTSIAKEIVNADDSGSQYGSVDEALEWESQSGMGSITESQVDLDRHLSQRQQVVH
ncbi:hypothetical protein BD770DRAFT_417129, partial [Pilaira anomala]